MTTREEAEKLLPCHCTLIASCPALFRPDVAAALDARDAEIAELRAELEGTEMAFKCLQSEFTRHVNENNELRAELEKQKDGPAMAFLRGRRR